MRIFIVVVSISRILLSTGIYLPAVLPQWSSGTLVLLRARPCIEVRILPFQLNVTTELFHNFPTMRLFGFRIRRLCSHLSCYHGRASPAPLTYLKAQCSDFPPLPTFVRKSTYPTQQNYYTTFYYFC